MKKSSIISITKKLPNHRNLAHHFSNVPNCNVFLRNPLSAELWLNFADLSLSEQEIYVQTVNDRKQFTIPINDKKPKNQAVEEPVNINILKWVFTNFDEALTLGSNPKPHYLAIREWLNISAEQYENFASCVRQYFYHRYSEWVVITSGTLINNLVQDEVAISSTIPLVLDLYQRLCYETLERTLVRQSDKYQKQSYHHQYLNIISPASLTHHIINILEEKKNTDQ